MRLQPGTFLQGDKYRIIDVLGQGGFGITYLAEQVMAERKVCIKEFFPKEYYKRDEDSHSISLGTQGSAEIMNAYKAKFIKEAKTIAKLDHPNIIHIHDVFTENNTAYYVMEYIDGESLSDVVKRNGSALAESVAVDYIKQAASALGYIHERKIMHLDVKPANVMLRKEDGKPVLIDFGLSKQYDAEGNQTSSTPVGISHGFAPMEQYKMGGVKEFSPETDIYSLGATLYYLVVGAVPPQAADIADDGLPELPAHLSANVRNAIERSMEIQRKKRPHSMVEFVALLGDGNTAPAAPMVNNVAATAAPSVEDESTRFGAPQNDESTKFAEAPKAEPKRAEAPKKEWTPKYSTEKPKTSDDEKKKSRWWIWALVVLAIIVIIILLIKGCSDDGAKDSDAISSVPSTTTTSYSSHVADVNNMYVDDMEDSQLVQQEVPQEELDIIVRVEEEAPKQQTQEQQKVQAKVLADKITIVENTEDIKVEPIITEDASMFDDFSFEEEVEEEEVEEEIFTILEEHATFQGGGLPEFRTWVMNELRYPQIAQENGIQGNVVVEFVVDENGKIGRVKVLQSPDPILSDAAVEAIMKANSLKRGWKPGKQRGKAVKQKFILPVSFKLVN